MTCGIYLIENKNTKQKYIGQSVNIEKRWKDHCNGYAKKYSYIDRAINKYGEDNFKLTIIYELTNDINLLNEMEKYYIWKYNTFINEKHYNLTPGGENSPMCSENVRKKVSQTKKGITFSDIHKKHLSEAHKGKVLSKEHRENISKSLKKTLSTDFYKAQRSINMLGKKHPSAKYTIWDIKSCRFFKNNFYKNNPQLNPRHCFAFCYNGKRIIGNFIDFYTPELLFELTEEFRIS